ncbi:MAG: diversity-generating retroelement protein Avd [Bacteroidota bacterium]
MSKKQNTIAQKVYTMLLHTIPVLNRFPRNQKFTLGDRIQHQLSDLLELYVHAYYAPKAEKKALLVQANIQLEITRHYFRLGYDLGLYALAQYQYFAKALHEIGSMTGGWIKSIEDRN